MDENYFDENAEAIVKRFEQYLSGKDAGYFDVSELETLVDYYLHTGRTKDSNRALDVGLRLHPASSELQLKRAKTFLATGEIHKALTILGRVPTKDNYEAQLLRIDALSKLNRMDEAELIADHLLENSLNDLDNIALDIAFEFMAQENYSLAIKYLLHGDNYNPHNIDLLFELAFCYEQIDKLNQAIATYNRILDIDAYINEAWFNIGQVYFVQEKYQQALEAYDFCLAIEDKDALVWLQKGHVHFLLGQYQQAIDSYVECSVQSKEHWQINSFIGECYEKLENYALAQNYYDKSLAENAENYDAYIGKAICLLEQEAYTDSISILNQAAELCPNNYDVWVYLAEAYSNLDLLEESRAAYEKSLLLEPNQPETLLLFGNLLMDMACFQDAYDVYLKAYKLDKTLEHICLLLSIASAKTKHYKEMFSYLDMATADNPKMLEIFLEMCPETTELFANIIAKIKKPLK